MQFMPNPQLLNLIPDYNGLMQFMRVLIFFAQKKPNIAVRLLVGVAGFEPAASCSQSRRDNRATLHPVIRVQR